MRVSAEAAEAAMNGNGQEEHHSPALDQLRRAIDGGVANPESAEAFLERELLGVEQAAPPETVVAAMSTEAPANTAPPAIPARPAYDPIAEIESEISEIGRRIVEHSASISKLDAALKAEKKSWKTAADELVEAHTRKEELLLDRQRIEMGQVAQPNAASPIQQSPPESTESFHARIDTAFSNNADSPPTPDQQTWDQQLRSLAIDGLDGITPKIVEILHGNGIYTVGAFQDWPANHSGCEYTQMSAGGSKLTEARFEKIQEAMMAYMKENPRPAGIEVVGDEEPAVSEPAVSEVEDI